MTFPLPPRLPRSSAACGGLIKSELAPLPPVRAPLPAEGSPDVSSQSCLVSREAPGLWGDPLWLTAGPFPEYRLSPYLKIWSDLYPAPHPPSPSDDKPGLGQGQSCWVSLLLSLSPAAPGPEFWLPGAVGRGGAQPNLCAFWKSALPGAALSLGSEMCPSPCGDGTGPQGRLTPEDDLP